MDQAFDDTAPMIGQHSSIKRKYLAEAGLHLFTGGPAMFRPSDIYHFSSHPSYAAALAGTNVYIICQRRRISVCPHSIKVSGGGLCGEFIVHGDSYLEWERERFFLTPTSFNPEVRPVRFVAARSTDSFGHAVDLIDEHGRRSRLPCPVLVASSEHDLGNRTRLEVLYVGQSFGKGGERVSAERLKRHTTLQRILADYADASGTTEILLLGFQYGSAKNWMSTAGNQWVVPAATSDEELLHMSAVGAQEFDRRTRVLLAEAALINYFKPQYNEMHRDSFRPDNNQKLKTLKKLFRADMSALVVELNTSNIGAKLWSAAAPYGAMEAYLTSDRIATMRSNALSGDSHLSAAEVNEWLKDQRHAHIAHFALYDRSVRETFLHELPWNEKIL